MVRNFYLQKHQIASLRCDEKIFLVIFFHQPSAISCVILCLTISTISYHLIWKNRCGIWQVKLCIELYGEIERREMVDRDMVWRMNTQSRYSHFINHLKFNNSQISSFLLKNNIKGIATMKGQMLSFLWSILVILDYFSKNWFFEWELIENLEK